MTNTKLKHQTDGQSILTALGTTSGMAFAVGISVISEIDEKKLNLSLAMVGGITGFYLANSILNLKPENMSTTPTKEATFSIMPTFYMQKSSHKELIDSIVPAITMEVVF